MRGLARSIAIVAAAAVAATGCGSDYKGLTKAAFLTQADAICTRYETRRTTALKPIQSETDSDKVVAFLLDKVIPIQRDELDELKDLSPPKVDRAEIKRLWSEVDAGTDELQKKLEDDPDAAFAPSFEPYKSSNKRAKAYGFKTCGAES